MTEIEFKGIIEDILTELGIDYAYYDLREGSDWVERELDFRLYTDDGYIDLGIFNFGDYDVFEDSSRDEIKNTIIEMNEEVKDKLRNYKDSIESILKR